MPRIVIEACTKIMYAAYIAEKAGARKIFKMYAKKSPFLSQQLHDFFLGR